MKKMLSLIIIGLLGLSMFSMFTLWTAKAQEIVWNTNPTPLPNPTCNHISFTHNGKVYTISGANDWLEDWVEIPDVYFCEINPDGTISSWTATTPIPQNRTHARAVVWNDFVYVVGGYCSMFTEPTPRPRGEKDTVYYAKINPDGSIGDWDTATPLPDKFSEHGAVVWNGRIYVLGGWNGYYRKSEVYYAEINADGSIGSWFTTTPLPLSWSHMGALVYNGKVYVIGGLNALGRTSSVYYASVNPDGTLGAWSEAASLPARIVHVRATIDEGDIYVVGGWDESGLPTKNVYKATIEPDATISYWEELQSIPEERGFHSLVAYQNRIYVIGGLYGRETDRDIKDTIYYSSTRAPTKWAVVVGVDEYLDQTQNIIGGAASNSAIDMYEILVDYMNFPSDHVHLLLDQVGNSVDDVTRATVEKELEWLQTVAIPEDIVVFYYAGHGMQVFDNEFMVLHQGAIPDYEFAAEVDKIKSHNICIILEMSVSGGFIKDGQSFREGLFGVGGEWSDLARETPSGRVVLTACAENVFGPFFGRPIRDARYARIEWPRREGVFTHFLVEGFKGYADINHNGKVTVEEAFRYTRIRPFVLLWQTPMIYDGYPEYEGEGELYLGD